MITPGLAAYSATKGAVKMFTQGLAREVGDRGITVNNIQPGPIDTELNPPPATGPFRRSPTPPSIATAASTKSPRSSRSSPGPESSYITGANLTVDGGTNA